MRDEAELERWKSAIAFRISDEWSGKSCFPEEAEIVRDILLAGLMARPDLAELLIGSGVIEESYFNEMK